MNNDELRARIDRLDASAIARAELAIDSRLGLDADGERGAVVGTLLAAAVPHWTTPELLQAVVDLDKTTVQRHWSVISDLPFVDSFPARGEGAVSVHEAWRFDLLQWLGENDLERRTELSAKYRGLFRSNSSAASLVERLYHSLMSQRTAAAVDLERLDREWSVGRSDADRDALRAMLIEVVELDLADEVGCVRSQLILVQHRAALDGPASLVDELVHLLGESEELADQYLVADVHLMLGEALEAAGHYPAALESFDQAIKLGGDETLPRFREPGRRRELGVAWGHMAGLRSVMQDHAASQQAAQRSLEIAESLEPNSDSAPAVLLRDLGLAHFRMGVAAVGLEQSETALASFMRDLEISEQLAASYPEDQFLGADVVVSCNRVGATLERMERYDDAASFYRRGLQLAHELREMGPSNSVWAREHANLEVRLGTLFLRRGESMPAYNQFRKGSELFAMALDLDPQSIESRVSLGVATYWSARGAKAVGDEDRFGDLVAKLVEIFEEIHAGGIARVRWEDDLRALLRWLSEHVTDDRLLSKLEAIAD